MNGQKILCHGMGHVGKTEGLKHSLKSESKINTFQFEIFKFSLFDYVKRYNRDNRDGLLGRTCSNRTIILRSFKLLQQVATDQGKYDAITEEHSILYAGDARVYKQFLDLASSVEKCNKTITILLLLDESLILTLSLSQSKCTYVPG